MNVSRPVFAGALMLALLAPLQGAQAEGATYRHEKSIYQDDKEVPLKFPEGVACTGTSLIVADTGNGRILPFNWKDGSLTGGGGIKLPQITYPVRLQIDSKGDLLVLDRKARKIGRVDVKRAFAGWLEVKGVGDASAIIPGSFKLDAADNVYLLDIAGGRVLVLDPSGKLTRELPLPKTGSFTDVAVDSAGKIYVLEAVAAVVWTADKGAPAFQPLTKGMKDRMSFPAYILVERGRIAIVDQNGMGVVVLGTDGSYQGRELTLGWSDGQLYYPAQICMLDDGDVFIADRQNSRIQIFRVKR
jgi:DNA-binding beta-propeller fold protein YncE